MKICWTLAWPEFCLVRRRKGEEERQSQDEFEEKTFDESAKGDRQTSGSVVVKAKAGKTCEGYQAGFFQIEKPDDDDDGFVAS